jgi:hypothetical protein
MWCINWRYNVDVKDRQQAPPNLTFASPLANYHNRSGVAAILSHLENTHVFKQEFFYQTMDILLNLLNLLILPSTMELIAFT